MSVDASLRRVLEGFEAVSLEELDASASLQRRVDNKYLISWEQFTELAGRLRDDHRVLEIDGRRCSTYESIYFDTPSLRCYEDHVAGRRPRFKARSRFYRSTGECVFEVKLKRADGEMDKRHLEYPVESRAHLTPRARDFLDQSLREAGLEGGDFQPSLTTGFMRVTFGSRRAPERTTCDFAVQLSRPGEAPAQMREELCLVETKSEHGSSPADRVLAEIGVEPRSFSKYQVGIQMLSDREDHNDPAVARAFSDPPPRRADPAPPPSGGGPPLERR